MSVWNVSAVVHSTDHDAAVHHYELPHRGSPHMSEIAKHWIDDGWTGSGTDAGFRACPARLTRPGPALNERGYYVGLS